MVAWLTRSSGRSRFFALFAVASLTITFGWIDYVSGIWVSLQLFYLIPIILTVAWFGWRAGCVIAAFCVGLRFAGDVVGGIFEQVDPAAIWWNRLIDLCVCFILIAIFHALLSLQRQLERRVEERTAALQEAARAHRLLEQELLTVAANERNSFGQELHDDICQHLVGTAFAAKVLASRLTDHDAPAALEAQAIVALLETGADKARKLARGLLMSEIQPTELGERLAQLATDAQRAGVACRFTEQGEIALPHPDAAAQLFRIAQEAVRNALRHAAPRNIEILLTRHPKAIALTVTDDGRGLPPPGRQGAGMGLRIMAQRATYAGGTFSVGPHRVHGTRIYCYLPLISPVA